MRRCLVVDIVPRDRVVPAAGGGPAHGEDELLVEGSPQKRQGPRALWGVWEVCRAGRAFVWLTGAGVLLLRADRRGVPAQCCAPLASLVTSYFVEL